MRTLLQFVIRYHFTLLFISLEIIGLSLLSNFNSYQQARVIHFRNTMSGRMATRMANLRSYFLLEDANASMSRENTELYNKLRASYTSRIDPTEVDTTSNRK